MAVQALGSWRWLHRFAAAKRGATAVEFAFVAVPFLALIFGTLELGMVFMASTTLDSATDTVSRRIRTGQFQLSGSNNIQGFKTAVCNEMNWLSTDCTGKLYVAVKTFTNFSSASMPAPGSEQDLKDLNDPTKDPTKPTFTPGGPEDIVVVRVYYEWNLVTPLMGQSLETLKGSRKRLISSTTTFRNEPYLSSNSVGSGR